MGDVADLDSTTQQRMADVLETRGVDRRQQEMRQAFLADSVIGVDIAA